MNELQLNLPVATKAALFAGDLGRFFIWVGLVLFVAAALLSISPSPAAMIVRWRRGGAGGEVPKKPATLPFILGCFCIFGAIITLGTLIVQNNFSVNDFNNVKYTPYPAQLSNQRVSVEEAPVEILEPDNPILKTPNNIDARDFDGWVQERGLYFMDQWDSNFKPLLACHDSGEPPQKGGLLKAQFGKGTYIYTGYAFFRQLPAGVPGAIRLYVNLLSAEGGEQ